MKRKSISLLICIACMLLASCGKFPVEVPGEKHSAGKNVDKAIVFIHGFTGNKVDTWTNRGSETYWPGLIDKDKNFDQYDVKVVEYPANLEYSDIDLIDLGRYLNRLLRDQGVISDGPGKYREVIFIAHSFGNLVLRSALYQSPSLYKHVRIPLVVSLASPSEGAIGAELFSIVAGSRMLEEMAINNAEKYRDVLNGAWENYPGNTKIHCYYGPSDALVSRSSSCAVCSEGMTFPVEKCGHSMVAKPEDYKSKLYQWVSRDIIQAKKQITGFDMIGQRFVNIYANRPIE